MDSGTENLDATARVVRRIVTFTEAGGTIHVIVQGVNVGAQSYFDALATMLMHTRGVLIMTPNASMVLTGRAALEASGAVSAEDEQAIGGFERIMGPNGQAQYFAGSLADAYRLLLRPLPLHLRGAGGAGIRDAVRHVGPSDGASVRDAVEDDPKRVRLRHRVGEIFDDRRRTPGASAPSPCATLMSARDRPRRRTRSSAGARWVGAETAIVWDAHLGGHSPVTLIGIESKNAHRATGYRPQRRSGLLDRRHPLSALVQESGARAQRRQRECGRR